jgi:ABC-2 type transport system ATP-binding protein
MDSIIIENLAKTYGNGSKPNKAVDGVSFRVKQGEIFGLLGPNGAGKSTTVRILATLTQSDGGRAEVAGRDVAKDPSGVRERIGYVAQASGVDKWGTGRENLTLQARLMRVAPASIAGRVDQLLSWVNLTDAAGRIVKTYSGGMKRRLDLAMGLVNEPAVLFLDEPTTGLDPETRNALWNDLIRLRKERNLTVLLTTHYLEEADHLCDRLAIVDKGKVVVEGTPTELKARISGDTVSLEVGGEATTLVAEAVRASGILRPLEGVLEVIPDGNSLIARVHQGTTAMPALIAALERADIAVRSATLGRPTLDDVYLHHTGHRFVQEDKEAAEGKA